MTKRPHQSTNESKTIHKSRKRRRTTLLEEDVSQIEAQMAQTYIALKPNSGEGVIRKEDYNAFPIYTNPFMYKNTQVARLSSSPSPLGLPATRSKRSKRHIYLKMSPLPYCSSSWLSSGNQSVERLARRAPLSLRTSTTFLKCPWCIIQHLEYTSHNQHCYCVDPDQKPSNKSILCLSEIFYNDTQAYEEHIIKKHFGPRYDGLGKFAEIDKMYPSKYAVTKNQMKMATPLGIGCPFTDCGIKVKSGAAMVDHLVRRHSQAISLALDPTKDDMEDLLTKDLQWPLGFRTTFIMQREQCLKKIENRGTFLQCYYNGITTEEFKEGLHYQVVIPRVEPTEEQQ